MFSIGPTLCRWRQQPTPLTLSQGDETGPTTHPVHSAETGRWQVRQAVEAVPSDVTEVNCQVVTGRCTPRDALGDREAVTSMGKSFAGENPSPCLLDWIVLCPHHCGAITYFFRDSNDYLL